jgi:hypothetical protein
VVRLHDARSGVERANNAYAITASGEHVLLKLPTEHGNTVDFPLHGIFQPAESQEDVCHTLLQDLVRAFFKGVPSLFGLFGGPQSGKTHTLIGQSDKEAGLLARLFMLLFHHIHRISQVCRIHSPTSLTVVTVIDSIVLFLYPHQTPRPTPRLSISLLLVDHFNNTCMCEPLMTK